VANNKQDPRTLQLAFELARANLQDQLTAARDVDSKILQTFAAASVLVGLATLRGIKLPGHHHTWGLLLVCVAVLAFVWNAIHAVDALRSRKYGVPLDTPQIIATYWYDPPNVLMDAYVHHASDGYTENERHHRTKHQALRQCLIALLIEATAIGVSLIVTNL
jgi:hypothetical protein